ncbi:MAG: endolytic transglycosylase MltG [Armatimonadota bacterium]
MSFLAVLGGGGLWFKTECEPAGTGAAQTLLFTKPRGISATLTDLESRGMIKSAFVAKVMNVLSGSKKVVPPGAYRIGPAMSVSEVLTSLRNPIKQLIMIPEGRWIDRVAKVLEDKHAAKADQYIELTNHSEKFSEFGIPFFSESLEGFLYPDTYNFAPDIGADYVIRRQLMNFEKKTAGLGLTKENMRRTIIIASLVELEASNSKDRKMIAGVIENRIAKGMRLQIDPTVNYGMQEWRVLTYKDYTSVKSPYNTYLVKGLPPGPICSPTVKSIEAALHPIKHNFVYFIAMSDGVTRYTATYPEHLVNVKLRDTMKAQAKAQQQ